MALLTMWEARCEELLCIHGGGLKTSRAECCSASWMWELPDDSLRPYTVLLPLEIPSSCSGHMLLCGIYHILYACEQMTAGEPCLIPNHPCCSEAHAANRTRQAWWTGPKLGHLQLKTGACAVLTCPFSKFMITETLQKAVGAKDESALMVRWRDRVRSLHHMRAELAWPKYQSASPSFCGCWL